MRSDGKSAINLLRISHYLCILGHLLKQSSRTVSISQESWKSRFFVLLSNNTLQYFRSEDDTKPKDSFFIGPGCTVSELFVEKHKKKPLYCIRIRFGIERSSTFSDESSHDGSTASPTPPENNNTQHPLPDHVHTRSPLKKFFRKSRTEPPLQTPAATPTTLDDDHDICPELRPAYLAHQKNQQQRSYDKLVHGTQIAAAAGAAVGVTAVTAGVGLVAGAIALGVAGAGGGAVALRNHAKQPRDEIIVASHQVAVVQRWRAILLAVRNEPVQAKKWWWCQDAAKARAALVPETVVRQPRGTQTWETVDGGWAVLLGSSALRLTRRHQAWKASVVLETTVYDAFLCFMSQSADPSAVVESIDEHTDVVRWTLRSLFLFPSHTTAREFCLYRYVIVEETWFCVD